MLGLVDAARRHDSAIRWTVISADPRRSADELAVDSIPTFGFAGCANGSEREAMLQRIDEVLASGPQSWASSADRRWALTLEAIRASDAVIIAGGGNISRAWPDHVFERAALVRTARHAGRPVATTGQALGPFFGMRNRELVSEILAGCRVVGVRDPQSFRIASDLGVAEERLRYGFDDAVGLEPAEPAGASAIVAEGPFIAVTLNRFDTTTEPRMRARLTEQLVGLSRETSALIVLVPHVGDVMGLRIREDVTFAEEIRSDVGSAARIRVAPIPTPREAVWYCRHAWMVVSSRYHPVVFALANGTPALFIWQDGYTKMKGEGALAALGQGAWSLSVPQLNDGLLQPMAVRLWDARARISTDLDAQHDEIRSMSQSHLTAVLQAVLGRRDGERVAHAPALRLGDPFADSRMFNELADIELDAANRSIDRLREWARTLEEQIGQAGRHAANLETRAIVAEAHAAEMVIRALGAEKYAALLEARVDVAEKYAGTLQTRAGVAETYAEDLRRHLHQKDEDLLALRNRPDDR